MTSIGAAFGNSYYQLSGQQTAGQTKSISSAPTLADVLNQSNTDTTNGNSAYTLDLSPEAQTYMNNNPSSSSGTSSTDSRNSFNLTQTQQTQISDILAKYKDSPYTQDTFNKIQDDLKAAGLSSDQLAIQDQIKSFNPTTVLLGYLNGTNTSITPDNSSQQSQARSTSYMQNIMSQWQSSSTTYAAASNLDTRATAGTS